MLVNEGALGWLQSNPDELVRYVARDDFGVFSRLLLPQLQMSPFHRTYYRVLDMFAHRKIRKLIVSVPPQHGKSQGSSRLLPAFILGIRPDTKIIIGSYAADVAQGFNRDIQRAILSERYAPVFPRTRLNTGRVRTQSSYACNAKQTDVVGRLGSVRAAGRGGPLTSFTADVSILDDVYKDYAEAASGAVREAAWKWYTTVVRSRLHKDSQELIVFTRWHEDDLVGRIEKAGEKVIEARSWSDLEDIPDGAWIHINFPALKVGAPTELDPRNEGEALWPDRHPVSELEERRRLDPNGFECLYQGNTQSAEGRLYGPFKEWVNADDWGRLIRKGSYTDVADEGDDFLAHACYEIRLSPNRVFNEETHRFEPLLYALVTDFVYTDENTDVTLVTVPRSINEHGVRRAWVESNSGGAQFAKSLRPKVRAEVRPFHQGGNKEARIVSNAAAVNRLVIMPAGWKDRFPKVYEHLTKFLRTFRANAHDDVEDMLTGIYEKELSDGNVRGYGGGRGIRRVN